MYISGGQLLFCPEFCSHNYIVNELKRALRFNFADFMSVIRNQMTNDLSRILVVKADDFK
jgi:hypothetical protein